MDYTELCRRFDYHAPDDVARVKHENARMRCKELAAELDVWLPEGREKSLAITHLEEVMFWTNAAIARGA